MSAPNSGTRTFHMIKAVAGRLEGAPRQLRRRSSDEFKARAVAEASELGASVSGGRTSAGRGHSKDLQPSAQLSKAAITGGVRQRSLLRSALIPKLSLIGEDHLCACTTVGWVDEMERPPVSFHRPLYNG